MPSPSGARNANAARQARSGALETFTPGQGPSVAPGFNFYLGQLPGQAQAGLPLARGPMKGDGSEFTGPLQGTPAPYDDSVESPMGNAPPATSDPMSGPKVPDKAGSPDKKPGAATPTKEPLLGPLAQAAKDRLEAQRFEHQAQLEKVEHFRALQAQTEGRHQEANAKAKAGYENEPYRKNAGPRPQGKMIVGKGAKAKTFTEGQEGEAAGYNNATEENEEFSRQLKSPKPGKPNIQKRKAITDFRPQLPLDSPLTPAEQAAYDLLYPRRQ